MNRIFAVSSLGVSTTPGLVEYLSTRMEVHIPTIYSHVGAGMVEHGIMEHIPKNAGKHLIPALGTLTPQKQHVAELLELAKHTGPESTVSIAVVSEELFRKLPELLMARGYENNIRATVAESPHVLCIATHVVKKENEVDEEKKAVRSFAACAPLVLNPTA